MRVLLIVHRVPHPPDRGDRIRSTRWVEALASRHEVHLGTLAEDDGDRERAGGLSEIVSSLMVARRPARARALRAMFTGRSMTEEVFRSRELRSWVRRTVATTRPDVAVGFSAATAQYLWDVPCPTVLDLVDADSEKWKLLASRRKLLFPLRWEAGRVRRLEELAIRRFSRVTVVSPVEAERFEEERRPEVLRNGVDSVRFSGGEPGSGEGVVMTGVMDYAPNVAGAVWFAREVLPLVRRRTPGATFAVVGARPAAAVRRLARIPGVRVTGRVDDIRPHLFGAAVAVAPMPIALGIANKVLEALAAGRPVVCTGAAARGLGASASSVLDVAEGPEAFAAAVCRLLADREERQWRSRAGRRLVEAEWNWAPVLDRMREIVSETALR